MTLDEARVLDARDALAPLRALFDLPDGVVYLDGNSLGALPRATAERVRRTVEQDWGGGLVRSWNDAGWIDLARGVAAKIAPLVGAGPAQVMVGDSTSINLFKVLSAAVAISRESAAGGPERRIVLTEAGNFPTDLYISESVAASAGMTLRRVASDDVPAALDDRVAVLLLTHVDYRSGRMADLAATTRAAHDAGALAVWDLAHSAGAVPVDLLAADADFAVGCGYKYLNGGPGAPAFLWVHPRHLDRMQAGGMRQPLSGWLGHAAPFDFSSRYRPAEGVERFACGTPPILSLAALDVGLDVFAAAAPLGGMAALRAKSLALTDAFIAAVDTLCADHDLALATPREHARRGSQVSYAHRGSGRDGYAVMQALIGEGVIGDFRAGNAEQGEPDLLRFGFTPLYTLFEDAWRGADTLRRVLDRGVWREAGAAGRPAVT